jgi:hypothetical protein
MKTSDCHGKIDLLKFYLAVPCCKHASPSHTNLTEQTITDLTYLRAIPCCKHANPCHRNLTEQTITDLTLFFCAIGLTVAQTTADMANHFL